MALPHAAIHHFRHNGYLKCRDLLPAETVTELKETILKDIAKEAEPAVRDKTDRVVRISQVLDRDPIFLKATRPCLTRSNPCSVRKSNSSKIATTTPPSTPPRQWATPSTATPCNGAAA